MAYSQRPDKIKLSLFRFNMQQGGIGIIFVGKTIQNLTC